MGSRAGSGVSRRKSRPASALSSASAKSAPRPETAGSVRSVPKSASSVRFSESRPGSGVQEVEDPWNTGESRVNNLF